MISHTDIGVLKNQISFWVLGAIAFCLLFEKSSTFFRMFNQTTNQNSELPKTSAAQSSVQELIRAVSTGNTELVKRLIKEGVNINDRDAKGGTSLMYAAFNYQKDASILN